MSCCLQAARSFPHWAPAREELPGCPFSAWSWLAPQPVPSLSSFPYSLSDPSNSLVTASFCSQCMNSCTSHPCKFMAYCSIGAYRPETPGEADCSHHIPILYWMASWSDMLIRWYLWSTQDSIYVVTVNTGLLIPSKLTQQILILAHCYTTFQMPDSL